MSEGWRTKADVLRDLGEVNGRRTGAEHLDQHVVAGEQPPPVHHEIPDEEEMSYFFGRHGEPAAGDTTGPDLAGISTMLHMVNNLDEPVGDETMTIYRNRHTDEISISKLNPHAGEYVPGGYGTVAPKHSPKKTNKQVANRSKITTKDVGSHLNGNVNGTKQNGLPTFNNMFKSKSDKDAKGRYENATDDTRKTQETEAHSLNGANNELATYTHGKVKSQSELGDKVNATANTNNVAEAEVRKHNGITPNFLENGLETRQINKSEEIKQIQDKIKSTIIASSTNNSLQTKRQKNVAIATLLKLGMVPETPIKLIKPDYFKKPPIEDQEGSETVEQVEKELPSTSSSETNVDSIEQDSLSKVDSWFSSMEGPKPRPQLQEKLVLKDCITYKKKTASSVTSVNTSTDKDERETKKRETKAFKPSAYASDLLKKYESNAQRRAPLIEDLGTRLERQMREKDEVIRQKMLARQNAG